MRDTHDIESPGDNGSRVTTFFTTTDNDNDSNDNNGGKGDRIKR